MRGRKQFLILAISIVFMLGITTAIVPIRAATPTVRIYVDQSLGYLPFEAPGTKFTFTINIATSGIADGTTAGIVQWKMDIRVDPNVLDINTTVGTPPPFPPPYAAKFSAGPGHFLYEYTVMMGLHAPSMFLGINDPLTGYQDEINEVGIPDYPTGAGDYLSSTYPKLLTVEITSKNDTQGCLIDLIDVMYRTPATGWHYAEQVEDGYYGTPPTFMSNLPPFDPTAPIGSTWHELYPTYSNEYDLTSWVDNGDGVLSASDQIDMEQTEGTEIGWIFWYHVDAVTTTIHFSYKDGPPPDGVPTGELGDAEPVEPHLLDEAMSNPIGSTWHMIYPDYSKEFVITSWVDNGDGVFSESDQFDFEFFDEVGTHWAHLDSVTTDLILSFKSKEPGIPEFPLGLGLMMAIAPAIPIVYLWRTRKKVVAK